MKYTYEDLKNKVQIDNILIMKYPGLNVSKCESCGELFCYHLYIKVKNKTKWQLFCPDNVLEINNDNVKILRRFK